MLVAVAVVLLIYQDRVEGAICPVERVGQEAMRLGSELPLQLVTGLPEDAGDERPAFAEARASTSRSSLRASLPTEASSGASSARSLRCPG